jgi:hypothetical protein
LNDGTLGGDAEETEVSEHLGDGRADPLRCQVEFEVQKSGDDEAFLAQTRLRAHVLLAEATSKLREVLCVEHLESLSTCVALVFFLQLLSLQHLLSCLTRVLLLQEDLKVLVKE